MSVHRTIGAIGIAGVLACALLTACGSALPGVPAPASPGSTSVSGTGGGWVDQPVSFQVDGMTVYGTWRHPGTSTAPVPAALLIAGSGPTDRNGNSTLAAGPIDTLQTLAGWLSDDGVASLRYDKLGTGQTGIGPYASHPQDIDMTPYEHEAAAALNFLAGQHGIDRNRLAVLGHSEGARFTLLMATGQAGQVPPIHAIGLIEPASRREFDTITEQTNRAITVAEQSGQLTADQAAGMRTALSQAVTALRDTGQLPANLPTMIAAAFPAQALRFIMQEDSYDPAVLASELPAHLPVIVSCSDADIQISCADVAHLRTGLTNTDTDFVQLHGVDHVLKEDNSHTGAHYTQSLPFSAQLRQALRNFATTAL